MSKVKQPEGTCRLCLSVSLLRRSHVVPKFLYEPLRDDDTHGFAAISDSGSVVAIQDGIYERMLCQQCEEKLQKWEDRAARILRRLPDLSARVPGYVEDVSGVDYKSFRLFCLSIIWRTSSASNPAFSEVSIEDNHQEEIRKAVLQGDPLNPLDYPVLLIRPCGPGAFHEYFRLPTAREMFSHPAYNFIMGGMYWIFFVCRSRDSSLSAYSGSFQSKAGVLPIHICSTNFGTFKGDIIHEPAARGVTRDHLGQSIRKRRKS